MADKKTSAEDQDPDRDLRVEDPDPADVEALETTLRAEADTERFVVMHVLHLGEGRYAEPGDVLSADDLNAAEMQRYHDVKAILPYDHVEAQRQLGFRARALAAIARQT